MFFAFIASFTVKINEIGWRNLSEEVINKNESSKQRKKKNYHKSIRKVDTYLQHFLLLICLNFVPVVGSITMDLPGGVTVYLQGNIGDNLNAYHYIGDESDVIITYSPMSQGLNGHALINGESFVLENCLDEGHVWKQLNLESLGENEGVDYLGLENLISEVPAPEWRTLEDTTSMATYSVKFYYTADFAAVTPDIQGFIDQGPDLYE